MTSAEIMPNGVLGLSLASAGRRWRRQGAESHRRRFRGLEHFRPVRVMVCEVEPNRVGGTFEIGCGSEARQDKIWAATNLSERFHGLFASPTPLDAGRGVKEGMQDSLT